MRTIENFKTIVMRSRQLLVAFICLYLPTVSHATIITYPQLSGLQGCQFSYTVQAKDHGASSWSTIALYNILVTNASGTQVNSTVGNFDCSGSTDIQITFSTTVTSAAIYPSSLNVTPVINGNTITFTISGPKKFYVDINGDHYSNCIHIAANPIEVNPPQNGDSNVIFVPTGTYNSSSITLTSGQTLYIQGGAAVASVIANNVSNVKILGRGFIYRASYNAIEVKNSTNVTIDGVIDLNHGWGGGGGCGINCAQSSNISINNAISFSSKKWGDGYDIFCSNGVTVNDVFIRTNDDAITFYGGGKSGYTGDCKSISVTNSTLLPDLAHSFHVGVYGDSISAGRVIRDITVSNIDICNQSRTTGQGCIYFTVGDKVRAANFLFNNIRVQDFRNARLIDVAVVYNSTYNYGPGITIDSVYFMNVTFTGSTSPGSSVNGYDAARKATNVFFNNLKINGNTITGASAGSISIGSYASNVYFSSLTAGETYVLTAKHSGKCSNVSGGSTTAGAQVVQNAFSGRAWQKWVLEDAGNGYYKFKNVNSGMYMDITGGSMANGATAEQWTSNTGLNQQFLLIPQGSGYYNIVAHHSGKYLDVSGASTSEGATILQWQGTGATNQLWLLQPSLDTVTYVVTAKHSGLCANVSGGSTSAGAPVVQNTYNGGANQKWVLENAGNGYYKFRNVNSGQYMDITGASTADGATLEQWTAGTGQNQQFYLNSRGNGYYNIIARHSDKCLDVSGASTSEGAAIVQWTAGGNDNESWLFQSASASRMVTIPREETPKSLAIFPNPTANMLYIRLLNLNGAEIDIYDLQGALILGKKINGSSGTVGVTGLPSGTYIIKIDDGQQQISRKFTKM